MKALIAKDMASMRKTLFLIIILILTVGVYAIKEQAIIILIGFCAMMPLILISVTFTNDDKANFSQLAFSMPISKKDFVLSKLFFAFIFSLMGAIIMFIFLFIEKQVSINMILVSTLFTFIMCILVSAIQFPFILKFGVGKGRIVMIITYFVIYRFLVLSDRNMTNFLKTITTYSSSTIGLVLSFIGLLIIFFCVKFSISIVKNKEF